MKGDDNIYTKFKNVGSTVIFVYTDEDKTSKIAEIEPDKSIVFFTHIDCDLTFVEANGSKGKVEYCEAYMNVFPNCDVIEIN